MRQLTNNYMADPSKSKCALNIANLQEPIDNDHLRRIWRHAFQLACAGFDNFQYQTSHEHSTVWTTQGGENSARVYEPKIVFQIGTDVSFTLEMSVIEGQAWFHWLSAHGRQV